MLSHLITTLVCSYWQFSDLKGLCLVDMNKNTQCRRHLNVILKLRQGIPPPVIMVPVRTNMQIYTYISAISSKKHQFDHIALELDCLSLLTYRLGACLETSNDVAISPWTQNMPK